MWQGKQLTTAEVANWGLWAKSSPGLLLYCLWAEHGFHTLKNKKIRICDRDHRWPEPMPKIHTVWPLTGMFANHCQPSEFYSAVALTSLPSFTDSSDLLLLLLVHILTFSALSNILQFLLLQAASSLSPMPLCLCTCSSCFLECSPLYPASFVFCICCAMYLFDIHFSEQNNGHNADN